MPKSKISPFLFFSIILLFLALTTDLAVAREDPELQLCKRKCQQEEGFDKNQLDDFTFMWENAKSPAEKLSECHKRCDAQTHGRQRSDCRDQCWEDYRRHAQNVENPDRRGEELEEEEGEVREKNPYLFQDQHFQTKFETEHGRFRILQNFAERSELLAGLHNHRVAILEADPTTFIAPAHADADALYFVAEGKPTINLLRQDKTETFNLKRGDIIRVPSGTTVYLINTSKTKKLVVIKLYQPVSTPGHFATFFGPGGQNPESFFNVFSPELLESAFNAKREQIKRVLGKKTQGVIIKVSQQQIRAMSQGQAGQGRRKEELGAPFSLFEKPATSHSNQYGKLYQISSSDNKDLRQLNVGVSYANISRGSMTGPFYNSKATKIVLVIRGEGYFEMACPHLSKSGSHQQQQHAGTSYVRASGKLRKGVLIVVPAGHPVITVSGGSQNLELLCLEVNDLHNEKFLLAGKKNIISLLEKTALELSFGGVPEKESREVFGSQTEYLFFKGPNYQQQEEDGFAASA